MAAKSTGQFGEDIAIEYLKKKGFKILDQNFVFRIPGAPQAAEIDIICKKDGVISFVEVKTSIIKNQTSYWFSEERVNFAKQRKIKRAAELWLSKHKISFETPMQLDIISVSINNSTNKAKIRYLPNIG